MNKLFGYNELEWASLVASLVSEASEKLTGLFIEIRDIYIFIMTFCHDTI